MESAGEPLNLPKPAEHGERAELVIRKEEVIDLAPSDLRGRVPAAERLDEDERAAQERLERLKPLCRPGAVFMASDVDTGRTGKPVRRPAVIVHSPSTDGHPIEVLRRRVAISTRTSWKPHHFAFPIDDESIHALLNQGVVFTDAGVLARFTKPGFFELARREGIALGQLDPDSFAGWLPRPFVEWIVLRLTGRPLKNPYPPAA